MQEVLLESLLDCLKQLPFLFLSYLVVEYAEHKMSSRTKDIIYRAGKAGPLLGGLIGVIPQCGFAAAAAGLFAGGVISPGTLIAVFLSTSDEMLPIMVSGGIAAGTIGKILVIKVLVAAVAGFLIDFVWQQINGPRERMPEHPKMCEHEHCGCSEHGIMRSAVHHTLHITVYLFLISVILGFGMDWFRSAGTIQQFIKTPGVEEIASALVGMIPNCAASVLITQLYVEGVLGAGALFSGLLCGAGTGLLVLFRENRSMKVNLVTAAVLYVTGVLAGGLIGLLGIL